MKRRCQCPKPECCTVEYKGTTYYQEVRPTDLHFKVADRECERCGAALCAECEIKSTWGMEEWELRFPHYTPLCRTCAEIANE